MRIEELQAILINEIPLVSAMELRVRSIDHLSVCLDAPLAPNSNHQGTAFGGSLYSVAVLAAWSLATVWLADKGLRGSAVVQRGEIDYLLPVAGALEAHAAISEEDDARTLKSLQRRGVARLTIVSELGPPCSLQARLVGAYVIRLNR